MRIIKFIISGVSAAGLEFFVFLILNYLFPGGNLIFAQTVSFVSGFILSFSLNRAWVFGSTEKIGPELLKYLILLGINLVLSNIILTFIVDQLNIIEWLAKLIVMVMVASWNYILFQKIIFRNNK